MGVYSTLFLKRKGDDVSSLLFTNDKEFCLLFIHALKLVLVVPITDLTWSYLYWKFFENLLAVVLIDNFLYA